MTYTDKKSLTGQIAPDSNTPNSAKAANSNAILNYTRDNLLKSIDKLALNIPSAHAINTIGQLLFYALHPDCAKEMEKDDIISLVSDQSLLISLLSEVYTCNEEYHNELTKNQ